MTITVKKIYFDGDCSDNLILKSIRERNELQAMFWNAQQDKRYIDKDCPNEFKDFYHKRLIKYAKKYKKLRKKFEYYNDPKSLKADEFFESILKEEN